jgi:hypothetical protein
MVVILKLILDANFENFNNDWGKAMTKLLVLSQTLLWERTTTCAQNRSRCKIVKNENATHFQDQSQSCA